MLAHLWLAWLDDTETALFVEDRATWAWVGHVGKSTVALASLLIPELPLAWAVAHWAWQRLWLKGWSCLVHIDLEIYAATVRFEIQTDIISSNANSRSLEGDNGQGTDGCESFHIERLN